MTRVRAVGCLTVASLTLAACTPGGTATAGAPGASPAPVEEQPSATLVPIGFGTLRQEDLSVTVSLVGGVTARARPLDEGIIRLLSTDSYDAARGLLQARANQLAEIARRYGFQRYAVWQVTFYGTEQGEAQFSPQEVIVTSAGRDYRPVDLVPLTPGFGEQRLRQRAQQSALYVFDGTLDVNQPDLTVTIQGVRDESWGTTVLPRIERERALVRSRANGKGAR